jgi:hypothetical protein
MRWTIQSGGLGANAGGIGGAARRRAEFFSIDLSKVDRIIGRDAIFGPSASNSAASFVL